MWGCGGDSGKGSEWGWGDGYGAERGGGSMMVKSTSVCENLLDITDNAEIFDIATPASFLPFPHPIVHLLPLLALQYPSKNPPSSRR